MLIGSSSGSIYSVSLSNGQRSVFSTQTAHAAAVTGLVQGVGEAAVLSLDSQGLLVAWGVSGDVLASTQLDVSADMQLVQGSGPFAALIVGAAVVGVSLRTGGMPALDCCPLQGTAVPHTCAASVADNCLLLADSSRGLHAVPLPSDATSWSADVVSTALPAVAQHLSAHFGDGDIKVLASLEDGRVCTAQASALASGDLQWEGSASTLQPPGHVAAAFWSSPSGSTAAAVFGGAGMPVPGSLSLSGDGPAAAGSGTALKLASQKRPRGVGELHASIADLVPAAKKERSSGHLTLGERVAELAAAAAASDPGDVQPETSEALARKSASVTIPLSQALAAGNDALLERCLTASSSQEAIHSTVSALTGADALKLLSQLMSKFDRRPTRGAHLLKWMNAVLQCHAGSLMSVPDLSAKLMVLYQAVNQRMATFKKLLRLKGRLNLLLAHSEGTVNA